MASMKALGDNVIMCRQMCTTFTARVHLRTFQIDHVIVGALGLARLETSLGCAKDLVVSERLVMVVGTGATATTSTEESR